MAKRKSSLPLILKTPLKAAPVTVTASTPTTRWVTITPDIAAKWLDETNTNNRPVREYYVKQLAADMAAGNWHGQNGEAIRFDVEGRLVDGQHRLWACLTAGVPFDSLLVTGVDSKTYLTIGIGRAKTFGDFAGPVGGEKNTALLTAVLRLVFDWRAGRLGDPKASFTSPSVLQLQEVLEQNSGVRESVNWVAKSAALKQIAILSQAAFIHFAASCGGECERQAAEEFLNGVATGIALTNDSPAYRLRQYLINRKTSRQKDRPIHAFAMFCKAWLAYREGKTLKSLVWTSREKFPVLGEAAQGATQTESKEHTLKVVNGNKLGRMRKAR